jgi:hypothetical protein
MCDSPKVKIIQGINPAHTEEALVYEPAMNPAYSTFLHPCLFAKQTGKSPFLPRGLGM